MPSMALLLVCLSIYIYNTYFSIFIKDDVNIVCTHTWIDIETEANQQIYDFLFVRIKFHYWIWHFQCHLGMTCLCLLLIRTHVLFWATHKRTPRNQRNHQLLGFYSIAQCVYSSFYSRTELARKQFFVVFFLLCILKPFNICNEKRNWKKQMFKKN